MANASPNGLKFCSLFTYFTIICCFFCTWQTICQMVWNFAVCSYFTRSRSTSYYFFCRSTWQTFRSMVWNFAVCSYFHHYLLYLFYMANSFAVRNYWCIKRPFDRSGPVCLIYCALCQLNMAADLCNFVLSCFRGEKAKRRHAKTRQMVTFSCFRMATFRPATLKNATFHALRFRLLFVVSLPGGAKGRHAKTRQNHHLVDFRVATFRVFAPKTRLYDMAQISHHS